MAPTAGDVHSNNLATGLVAGSIRVVFEFAGDRYLSRIEVESRGEWLPIMESVEGTSQDHWPPSPPLQDLRLEERPPHSRNALLVGKAGQSHWSLSVLADFTNERLTFEAACRARAVPTSLGSEFRIPGAADPTPGGLAWALRTEERAFVLAPLGASLCRTLDRDSSPGEDRGSPFAEACRSLRIEPATPLSGPTPCTVQWGWTIERQEID